MFSCDISVTTVFCSQSIGFRDSLARPGKHIEHACSVLFLLQISFYEIIPFETVFFEILLYIFFCFESSRIVEILSKQPLYTSIDICRTRARIAIVILSKT